MNKGLFLTTLLGLSLASGCSDDSGPTAPAASTFPQTITGTVSAALATCRGSDDYFDEIEVACQGFPIVAGRRGTLVARLAWQDRDAYLRVGAGTGSFVSWGTCTSTACESRTPVGEGGTTVWVGMDTNRSRVSSEAFELTVSLE